jgi:hypothetical protein
MSDRLKDLQRQRALAQEQLAWIDREIAKESGLNSATAPPSAPVKPAATAPRSADAARMAEEILARYKSDATASPGNLKRGCIFYFIFGLGALVLFAIGAYFLYVNRR